MKNKNLEALFDAIIVKPIEIEESSSNIIVPDLGNEKNKVGEVISVGPGKPSFSGDLIPTVLKVGDKVVLPTMGFTLFEYKGEEYWIGNEGSVLCKINK